MRLRRPGIRLVPARHPEGVVTRVVITSVAPPTFAVTDTHQLAFTAFDGLGNPVTPTTIVYSSSTPGVASIDAAGLVTAVAAGSAALSVQVDGVFAESASTYSVTGTIATVTQVIVTGPVTVQEGQQIVLTASPQDASGNVVLGQTVTWEEVSGAGDVSLSADSGVDPHTSTVTGLTDGVRLVRAVCNAVPSSNHSITVTDPPAPGAYTPIFAFDGDDWANDAAFQAGVVGVTVGFESQTYTLAPVVAVSDYVRLIDDPVGAYGKVMEWVENLSLNTAHNIFRARSTGAAGNNIRITIVDGTAGSSQRKITIQDDPTSPTVIEIFDNVTKANIGAAINTGLTLGGASGGTGHSDGQPSALVELLSPESQAIITKQSATALTGGGVGVKAERDWIDGFRGRQQVYGQGYTGKRNLWTRVIERFSGNWEIAAAVGGEAGSSVKHLFNRYLNSSTRWACIFQNTRGISVETFAQAVGNTIVTEGVLPWENTQSMNTIYGASGWPYVDAFPMFHADSGPGGAPTGDGEGQWWEIIMHAKLGVDGIASNRSEFTLFWRPLTVAGVPTALPYQIIARYAELESGQQTTPMVRSELGVYRNRQYDSDMRWLVKRFEAVDGSVYPDPWGVGISV